MYKGNKFLYTRKQCVICGRFITESFYICSKCSREFSIPEKYSDWPDWLQVLVKIYQRNLYRRRKEQDILIDIEFVDI
jgi:transposase-like protein